MKKKYRVIENKRVSEGVYEVVYDVWIGCYGNRKRKSVTLESERKPNLKQIQDYDRSTSV